MSAAAGPCGCRLSAPHVLALMPCACLIGTILVIVHTVTISGQVRCPQLVGADGLCRVHETCPARSLVWCLAVSAGVHVHRSAVGGGRVAGGPRAPARRPGAAGRRHVARVRLGLAAPRRCVREQRAIGRRPAQHRRGTYTQLVHQRTKDDPCLEPWWCCNRSSR